MGRDRQRKEEQELAHRKKAEELKEKQALNQQKLKETKLKMEATLDSRREEYVIKERLNDEKRLIFEQSRQEEIRQKNLEAEKKQKEIKDAIKKAEAAILAKKLESQANFDKQAEQQERRNLEKKLAIEKQKELTHLKEIQQDKV